MKYALNYRYQLFSILVVSGIVISALISVVSYFIILNYYHHEIRHNAQAEAQIRKKEFAETYQRSYRLLEYLYDTFDMYAAEPNTTFDNALFEKLFLLAVQSNDEFMQVRFIDAEGNEKLRVERNATGADAYKATTLQNKSRRHYFQKLVALPEGTVWTSPLDLNMEYGEIEKPLRPTMRLGKTLYRNNQLLGMIVINIDMTKKLNDMLKASFFDVMLIDDEGEILIHPNTAYRWSRYLNKGVDLHTLYSDMADAIKQCNNCYIKEEMLYAAPFFQNESAHENLKIVLRPKRDMWGYAWNIALSIIAINIALIPIHFLVALFISKAYYRLKKSQAVQEELLIQHSKLAAIGEMISFIAHQWRQPLNALSSTLIRVRTDAEFEHFDKDKILRVLDRQEERLQFLSQTIETFKNFYTANHEKTTFYLREALDQTLDFIYQKINEHGIKLVFSAEGDAIIKGKKNELMQVMLNLFTNAMDALNERKPENPKISVNVYEKATLICFDVADNGGGIQCTPVSEVFSHYTSKQKYGGSGIGLYVSKIIIEEHFEGKMSAYNSDEGAVFSVCVKKCDQTEQGLNRIGVNNAAS